MKVFKTKEMVNFTKNVLLVAALVGSTFAMGAESADRRGGRGGRGGGFGQERLQLQFSGEQFRGQNTLALKREIKRQYGHMNLQDAQLLSVKLVAKSKQGRGKATLVVGQRETYPQIVYGNPYDFDSNRSYTYDRVVFQSPGQSSQGRWQIKLRGNFKVKKVVVVIAKQSRFKQVRLDISDHIRGQSIIKLKREANQQSYVDLKDYELVSVKMKAKSKKGRAQASLVVGFNETFAYTVYGNPRDFHNDAGYTYSMIEMHNPSFDSQGKWQINLRGNIKVEEVILVLKAKNSRGGFFGHLELSRAPNDL